MSDRIEPALTAEEWASVPASGPRGYDSYVGETDDICAYLIALNNAALPDTDPRKITREATRHLRALRVFIQTGMMPSLDTRADLEDFLAQHIDALESYLPPEDA